MSFYMRPFVVLYKLDNLAQCYFKQITSWFVWTDPIAIKGRWNHKTNRLSVKLSCIRKSWLNRVCSVLFWHTGHPGTVGSWGKLWLTVTHAQASANLENDAESLNFLNSPNFNSKHFYTPLCSIYRERQGLELSFLFLIVIYLQS